MVYYKGLVLVPQYARLLLDTGKEKFPIWYDVYKNGVKVLEKVSTDKPFKGHNFIFVFGISEELYNVWKEEYKIELPQSVKDSVMFDLSGKRIKRAPFGKNYFTCDNTGKIILVKEDGTPVFNETAVFYEPIDSYYLVEFDSDYRPCLLNEDGDTVKASSCLLRYVNDGTLSFLDLRRYSNIDRDNISYFSSQSKQDKLATLEFYSGRLPVKPQQFDTMFFSEGLINLKINGVWCYMNEKGLGLPKKH